MAMDHNQSGRRPHYHRGRRGMDRRSNERRSQQAPEQGGRPTGDQVDVDQIMREIRARISQRHGIELSPQQIQDLAARRLEAILDPRNINPTLFDQLRKGAAAPPDPLPSAASTEYSITEDSIYEGGTVVRFFRRLLNPLMKLLFNPAPLIAALQTQTRINRDAATRAAELERRQTEWNALHYQILQRLVTEVSRTSIEMQAIGTRIEALSARVDFNDRRVRTLENTPAIARSQRPQESAPAPVAASESAPAGDTPPPTPAPSDAQRRRRRRRRGRRGSIPGAESTAVPAAAAAAGLTPDSTANVDEDDEDAGEPSESETTEFVNAPAEALSAETVPSAVEDASGPAWTPEAQASQHALPTGVESERGSDPEALTPAEPAAAAPPLPSDRVTPDQ